MSVSGSHFDFELRGGAPLAGRGVQGCFTPSILDSGKWWRGGWWRSIPPAVPRVRVFGRDS